MTINPDDLDWIDLSARQKRQIKTAMRRLHEAKSEFIPIPDGDPPISLAMRILSEEFQKSARRKIN
jgi:hypothetical protein